MSSCKKNSKVNRERQREAKKIETGQNDVASAMPTFSQSTSDMKQLYDRMCELEIAQNEDDICKEFLAACKKRFDSYEFSSDEAISASNQLCLSWGEIIADDSKNISEELVSLFSNNLSLNNDVRRKFSTDLLRWKGLMKNRKSFIREKLRLEKDIENQIRINMKYKNLTSEMDDKYESVVKNSMKIVENETKDNDDLKIRLQSNIDDVRKKFIENEAELQNALDENSNLVNKLDMLKGHFEKQSEEYDKHIHTRSLKQQLYEARLQQRTNIITQRHSTMVANNDHLTRLRNSVLGMDSQLKNCGSKFVEFKQTLSRNEEVFEKYLEQEMAMKEMVTKLERECDQLQKDLLAREESIRSASRLVDDSKYAAEELNKLAKIREQDCRAIQQKRALAIQSAAISSDLGIISSRTSAQPIPIPNIKPEVPSSSSTLSSSSSSSSMSCPSSSSSRSIRETITPSSGDESPLSRSPEQITKKFNF